MTKTIYTTDRGTHFAVYFKDGRFFFQKEGWVSTPFTKEQMIALLRQLAHKKIRTEVASE